MQVIFLKSGLLSTIHTPTVHYCLNLNQSRYQNYHSPTVCLSPVKVKPRGARAVRTYAGVGWKVTDKPTVCTADELHYVPVPNSLWRLALWRYTPLPQGPNRNHPLLLLSGVGTNALGYDLAPESSFARYMCGQGFDTWILEVRGAGLSREEGSSELQQPDITNSVIKQDMNSAPSMEPEASTDSQVLAKSDTVIPERLPTLLHGGLLQTRLNSAIARQIEDLRQKFSRIIKEAQRTTGLQKMVRSLENPFQKQLDMLMKYDWDFEHYLEEDVPAAMEYIRRQCQPKDNKLHAIGHSMGGILLYSMLSQNGCATRNCGLASVITLGSSLDYTTSRSSLKQFLPLVDPVQALNVPFIPLGALMTAAYPLASRPPYFLSWLKPQFSANDMMHPDMLEKLLLNNFCTIPTKVLLHLATAFQDGGLCNRNKTFFFKDHLHKIQVPVLALAGDRDLACPPEAVYETIKRIPGQFITFKVFGEPGGPHYGHYDLVGSRSASCQVYPCIINHLSCHDKIQFT